ncbi:uncharacterized protein TNCV_4964171 [Trichonephila clavipes]|nr:uncharacterized protein TNCV_4964171 [Trichonephila clavipes]
MPRASTKVFKKRRGVFNKGRCNKSNDGCGESNSTVPKNSADEKNCADGAKLCTNETEPSASKGAESARMFCGIMNLPPPPTKFSKYNHILLQATRETCEHSMAEAVREAVDENDGKRDLAVAVDGKKRGFSSKNGLVTVTSVDTGKVIDVEVFQNIVFVRTKTKHLQNCQREILKATARNRPSASILWSSYPQKFVSVKDMQQAIWAIFLHKLSTDEKPQHGFCPSDSDTWCKFKKAELLGETYHHKNSLPVDVVEAMRPVFRDLANPELRKKVFTWRYAKSNESVNNVIWSRVPKKTFVQLEVLSLGTYDAVSSFNMGNVSKLEILRKMCIEPGDYTVQAMECLDKQRLLRAKYYCLQKTKEVRKEKRLKRKKEDDELLKMLMI